MSVVESPRGLASHSVPISNPKAPCFAPGIQRARDVYLVADATETFRWSRWASPGGSFATFKGT
jgi:hypothetical protein